MVRLIASAAVVAAVAGSSSASILWNQPGSSTTLPNIVNQAFSDFPTFGTFAVTDVNIPAAGWNINTVRINVTPAATMTAAARTSWLSGAVNQARLNVFGPGALTGADDPSAGQIVTISTAASASNANFWTITATGLNINAGIGGGQFFIGLTPVTSFASNGQVFTIGSAIQGGQSFLRNPGGGFAFPIGTNWGTISAAATTDPAWANNDASLVVEGTIIPAPGALALLGLGGLVAGRRRR